MHLVFHKISYIILFQTLKPIWSSPYLRGGFNYNKLSSFDKFLMTLLKWKIKNKKKEDLSADEKGMLAIYDKPVDFTDKKNIGKIIAYVNS